MKTQETDSYTIGERIRMLRKSKGHSLDDLCNSVDVSKQTLHKYETGIIKNIPIEKIEKIANHFEISPAFIMGWGDDDSDTVSIIQRSTASLRKRKSWTHDGWVKNEALSNENCDVLVRYLRVRGETNLQYIFIDTMSGESISPIETISLEKIKFLANIEV